MLTQLAYSPYEIYCDDSLEREYPDEVHEVLEGICWTIYNVHLPNHDTSGKEAYLIEKDPDTGLLYSSIQPKSELKSEMIKQLGSVIQFGRYPQNSNFPEPITWRIIDIQCRYILLISDRVLDCRKYHYGAKGNIRKSDEGVVWKNCMLRKWLNTEFLQTAFSDEERRRLEWFTCRTQDNRINGRSGGGVTDDKVAILNAEEAEKYFPEKKDRKAKATLYAKKNGAHVYKGRTCDWWLRTPGCSIKEAAYVGHTGTLYEQVGNWVGEECGVRPVIRI